MSKNFYLQRAFTLVELAIVMTIIGLLIGGILKGQELLENARVTSTVAQVKSYEAAVTGFRDIYDGWPGDLIGAENRIPGCNANCNPLVTGNSDGYYGDAGDGVVGGRYWADDYNAAPICDSGNTIFGEETELFWMHLLKANLITGVTDASLSNEIPCAFGTTHPAAKIGGGFIIGYNDGRVMPDMPIASMMQGDVLVLTGAMGHDPRDGFKLTPLRAGQIDRKLDDGRPGTGGVLAFPKSTDAASNCFKDAGSDAYIYDEAVTTQDCGLIFQIQG